MHCRIGWSQTLQRGGSVDHFIQFDEMQQEIGLVLNLMRNTVDQPQCHLLLPFAGIPERTWNILVIQGAINALELDHYFVPACKMIPSSSLGISRPAKWPSSICSKFKMMPSSTLGTPTSLRFRLTQPLPESHVASQKAHTHDMPMSMMAILKM